LGEHKEEKKDLLAVIWSVAPESETQGPGEEDWVRLTKDVPMWVTNVVELEDFLSLYHLRNLLNKEEPQYTKVGKDWSEQLQQTEDDDHVTHYTCQSCDLACHNFHTHVMHNTCQSCDRACHNVHT